MAALDQFGNTLFRDKIYSGIAELRRRSKEAIAEVIDLRLDEFRLFSQNGEDGVIDSLWRSAGNGREFFVEFGASDGESNNCRLLAEFMGWEGVFIECDVASYERLSERYQQTPRIRTVSEQMSPENINAVFEAHEVPEEFGVLSIDIDGQDFWVWSALSDRYRPAVVVIEINSAFPHGSEVSEAASTESGPLTRTFGCSIGAVRKLGARKGYRLLHVDTAGVNAFLVRKDLIEERNLQFRGICDRSPNYSLRGAHLPLEAIYEGEERIDRETTQV